MIILSAWVKWIAWGVADCALPQPQLWIHAVCHFCEEISSLGDLFIHVEHVSLNTRQDNRIHYKSQLKVKSKWTAKFQNKCHIEEIIPNSFLKNNYLFDANKPTPYTPNIAYIHIILLKKLFSSVYKYLNSGMNHNSICI